MKICYVLLSPTFGMHQYTADLATRMLERGHQVHVVTTRRAPLDRYPPHANLHTPVETTDTGFSAQAFRLGSLRQVWRTLSALRPDVAHFAGPHAWNPLLLLALGRAGIATVHTLHDLHPHLGTRYGRLLVVWNQAVQRSAERIVVHGERYRREVEAAQGRPTKVECFPLTHLFVSWLEQQRLAAVSPTISYEPWALFFGRLEAYKGLSVLAKAASMIRSSGPPQGRVVIAGKGDTRSLLGEALPANVTVLNHLVNDQQAVDLFARCGLVVLPYIEATQSALVAAAYYFRKPVLVTNVGALPEYVNQGETGWVVPPGDPAALARSLDEALGQPHRLRLLGEAGRAWYEQADRQATDTLDALYADLAGAKASASCRQGLPSL
ncbi:MAG: glycosyltransferase family 4 protein [Chloroflexi bacterium]|nr:glycosyltransferase family 4 protein [Chloroflexota bacterium]